ncbi:EKC/KEOPS complex subunit PCC1-like [Lytechinus variegatus]|uniref:EKC/KEOPS complex subunit PCC1-like n=1 Tax=Lytechinus variegatus TaxID=7654 RepID=UPI001BB2CCA7|nr:EKC/KEOPS complex subunit PCC1-like [Lytechinus variegatus]
MDSTVNRLKSELRIPMHSEREAEIAYNSLSVDKEPRPKEITKNLRVDGATLIVNFSATQARLMRVAVGSFMDFLLLVTQTMEEFGPPVSKDPVIT